MHTVPLTTALIPAAASANASAFRADELFVWLQPRMHLNPDAIRHNATIKLRQRLNTPGVVVRVAVSDDNDPWWDESVGEEVLGYAVWERLGVQDGKIDEKVWGKDTLWKKFERKAVHYELRYENYLQIDTSYDYSRLAILNQAFGDFDPIMEDLMNLGEGKGHMWLTILCVDEKYQRRGIGKRLLEWGAKTADREGVATGLVSSPAGSGLYKRCGYREAEKIKYGPIEDWGMIRWPGGGDKPVIKPKEEVKEVNSHVPEIAKEL